MQKPVIPVAGYSLNLDADNASSFTYSTGSRVSQWSDLSGNGYNFTQATSTYQPERQNNIQNGLPSVYFNSYQLINTSWNWSASAYTVFVVVKNRTNPVYDGIFSRGVIGALQLGYDNTNKFAISRIGEATSTSSLTATGSNADVVVYKGSAVSSGSTTVQVYKNGTAAASTISMTGLGTGSPNVLGATRNVASQSDPIVGYISEVIIYPSQLSDTDRGKVEAYLKTKWGTP